MFLKPLDLSLSVSGSEGLELNTTENLHCPQKPLLAAGDSENINRFELYIYHCKSTYCVYSFGSFILYNKTVFVFKTED